ncbi:fork head domain-containing protein [Colletotrichum salicis]|uniref:Fork head domain-containing protein n=1 Tax=Colletotrichum salicis TaxID=1209931 RepID=A0A135TJ36_9PEZI|nr:fork head domain-containing protein [Colletotrichum salicis]
MDPVHASPPPSEFKSPASPRTPHHRTSHKDESAGQRGQQSQPQPVSAQNGTPYHSFSADLAFSHLAKTAVESSPSADKWLDEGGQKMTYAKLIHIALCSRKPKPMGLGELYHWFKQNTSRANKGSEGWKNSVRSNLSLNKAFQRVERKGSLWQLAEAGLTDFQPTRKPCTGRRASRRKKAEVSTEWKISVAPPLSPCASNPRDSLQVNMPGADRGDDGPCILDGCMSPKGSQPGHGPSADYPTPMSTVPMQDGLEYMHDPLWAWNLDSRRYIHWPYCSCLCSRHQFCWTGVDGMLQLRAPTPFPPEWVSAGVGSSPPSEMSVQWEI